MAPLTAKVFGERGRHSIGAYSLSQVRRRLGGQDPP